jgi:hypothetical protein
MTLVGFMTKVRAYDGELLAAVTLCHDVSPF